MSIQTLHNAMVEVQAEWKTLWGNQTISYEKYCEVMQKMANIDYTFRKGSWTLDQAISKVKEIK